MNFVSFGEIVWDIFNENKVLGGAPLNFASYVSILGENSRLISAVGNDELGACAIKELNKYGVNTEHITLLSNKSTAKCIVTLDENNIPSYNIEDDSVYDYIKRPVFTDNVDVLTFGSLALRKPNNIEVIKQILTEYYFSHIFVDINIRAPFYTDSVIDFCLRNATILKISEEELPVVLTSITEKNTPVHQVGEIICKKFPQVNLLIITRGENGAICYDNSVKKTYQCEALPVKVASTVGAGDSFSAAFLVNYLKNNDAQSALEFASKISAIVCSHKGAISEEIAEQIKNV